MFDPDDDIREGLGAFGPKARDMLRCVLIHEHADRDAVSSQLLRYRDGQSDDWADIIDMLTMDPEARRNVMRLLGEIGRVDGGSHAPTNSPRSNGPHPPTGFLAEV